MYSVVTDFYQPNPDRLRDWISIPKVNGYESLHTTVMSPGGRWVEVQIRTSRMDEVAEMGLAAHYRYKRMTRSMPPPWTPGSRGCQEVLEDVGSSAVDFVHDFKLDLFSDGDRRVHSQGRDAGTCPQAPPPSDFAFEIHTQVGRQCIGAR